MYLPVFGRIDLLDWPIICFSFILAWLEFVASAVAFVLPRQFINACTATLRIGYRFAKSPVVNISRSDKRYSRYTAVPGASLTDAEQYRRLMCISNASSIDEMCQVYGYSIENRIVKTKDDYLLTLHRIVGDRPASFVPKKVVYLHHGLLMSSEVWVTMLEKHQNLPFILYDLGYDVWLGNNRGNKYSQKHLSRTLSSVDYWDFSLDEFAFFDIPNCIDYILDITQVEKLTYIGFSQGTAQSFASVSAVPGLDSKIDQIIAISPATTPHGLYSRFLDLLLKLLPLIVFLLFSRRMLLPSVAFWQSILYPPFFATMIDWSNYILFNWRSENISRTQKIASYAHLYSTTSVKTVVHWFQIMKARNFQMYHDVSLPNSLVPISYPLQNITIPIHLIYGTVDSLVDIDVMRSQLPSTRTTAVAVEGHEHLDNLWGQDVFECVFSHVLHYLGERNASEKLRSIETNRADPASRRNLIAHSEISLYSPADSDLTVTMLLTGPDKNGTL